MRRTNLILVMLISAAMLFTSCGTQTAPDINVESPKPLSTSLLDSNSQRLDLTSGSEPKMNTISVKTEDVIEPTPVLNKETEIPKPISVESKTLEAKVTNPVSVSLVEKATPALVEEIESNNTVTKTHVETVTAKDSDLFTSAEVVTEVAEISEPVPVVPSFGWDEYMILPGDYLFRIAKKEYGDWKRWKDIYQWNREKIGENPNLIYPYHFLDMKKPADEIKKTSPTFNEYSVQEGDNLWTIAGKTYGDEKSWIIVYWDNEEELEKNDGVIYPGMVLKLRTKLDPSS